jgi:2-polyprenyl-3-methyl-5-hydroxy-6-metoxy-1,4-benzoquinol methylase
LAGVGRAAAAEVPPAAVTTAALSEKSSDGGSYEPSDPVSHRTRLISSVAELDAALSEVDAAGRISDDEVRRVFESFAMRVPTDVPTDPDSEAYRAAQLAWYATLHGKPYHPANEVSVFDPEAAADRPFPYQTASADTVGGQLMAIGYLIRTMNLTPGKSVLDVGAGWGNTSIALARMGHRVTALDIEQRFLDLIAQRARRKRLGIETVRGDFSAIGGLGRAFDAVLFFESFHHCADHQALVASLGRVVAPGGKIVFAGEPIDPDFPLPWGLRMDGQSLWAIRRQGWLELGFREDYFLGLLARHGWSVSKSVCQELTGSQAGWGTVYCATRS